MKILERGELWIPNTILDLRCSNPQRDSVLQLIKLFANVRRSIKSARIKESLFIKASLSEGVIHDSSGITNAMRLMVIEEYQKCNAIRQTSRRLKEIGVSVSPSSVSRIIKTIGAK